MIQKIRYRLSQIFRKKEGFSFIEVLVGMALVAIAMLGLAQLFTLAILNNNRADQMTNAVFLAQEKIEQLRNLTNVELSSLSPSDLDELLDINGDTTNDYRRLTEVQPVNLSWQIRILVFGPDQENETRATLLSDPVKYRVKADIQTMITR